MFVRRTGYGLDLETRQLPNIVAGSEAPLLLGTILKPGIYLPSQVGEDRRRCGHYRRGKPAIDQFPA